MPDIGLTLQEGAIVRVISQARDVRKLVAEVEVAPDGIWDDIRVDLEPKATYFARYLSPNGILKEQALGRPERNSVLELEFLSEQGYPLWFDVVNAANERIPEVVITGTWTDSEGKVLSRTATPRPDGYIAMGGLPPGVVTPRFEAPGYVTAIRGPRTVPEATPSVHIIELARAGATIRGTCTRNGVPVSDFDILSWAPSAGQRDLTQFRATDGTFELSGFAAGTRIFVASDLSGFHSSQGVLDVAEQGEMEISLEIPSSRFASGQIVDALTEAPVPSASVQPLLYWLGTAMGEMGQSIDVDSNAAFENLPLSSRNSGILVSAPGYATRQVEFGSTRGDTDLGTIQLHVLAPLSLQLVSATKVDFTAYILTVDSPGFSPVAFPEDGLLVVPVGPESLKVTVDGPNRSRHVFWANLASNQKWTREIVVSGGHRLHIEVLPAADSPLPNTAAAIVTFENAQRERSLLSFSYVPNPLIVDGVTGDWADIEISSLGVVLAKRHFELSSEMEQLCRVTLGGYGATLLVVDKHEQPIPGVQVYLATGDSKVGLFSVLTDARGLAKILGVEEPDILVHLTHSEHGTRNAIAVNLSTDSSAIIRLSLDTERSVEVQLLEGGLPISGIRALLLDENRRTTAGSSTSNANGIVRWSGLTPAPYALYIQQPGYWPMEIPIVLRDEDVQIDATLVRTAALHIQVVTEAEHAVPGLSIQLRYAKTDESLSDWIRGDRWRPPSSGLTTDSRGTLLLKEIPAGRYLWNAKIAAGRNISGFVVVQPSDDNVLRILCPE